MITVLQHLVLSGYRWSNGLGNQVVPEPEPEPTFGNLISPALTATTTRTN